MSNVHTMHPAPAAEPSADAILLTPGPLTTSPRTRQAMLRDWGSWDADFNRMTAGVRARLLDIIGGQDSHVCVPLQGSGTFSVEAAIGTVMPRNGHILILDNGAYCKRMARICAQMGRRHTVVSFPEHQQVSVAELERRLVSDPSISHVGLIHCETGAGVLNPLEAVAAVTARHGRKLIVDAMSSFAALDIDVRKTPITALIAASGKCLEGAPGMGFVFVRRADLEGAAGNSQSLALDLYDQWAYMEKTGQWRFTPPTHVVAALSAALDQYVEQGGLAARHARYVANCNALIDGMRALGFSSFLPAEVQAPIIVTFHAPVDPKYRFTDFYQQVKQRGYILYPGKLTEVETFRVGCIGAITPDDLRGAVAAIADALHESGITQIAANA